jgi:hypothetical protein
MIDFEDRMPAPPMGAGERLFLGFVVAMTIYGYGATLYGAAQGIAHLF